MKLLTCLVPLTCLVFSFSACSSSDSSSNTGGTSGAGTGATGGGGTGATGGGGTGATGGGGTGATGGGGTGATGGGGTGGGTSCPSTLKGQKCGALQAQDPKQTACITGSCCDEVEACLADDACASFIACGSDCLSKGGTPQSCGQECSTCLTSPTLYTAMGTCITTCAASDGGVPDGGGDAATD